MMASPAFDQGGLELERTGEGGTAAVEGPPLISVIVCVYNDSANLIACLESLRRQERASGGVEIIVVDDGSTEPLPDLAAIDPAIRLLIQPNQGPSGGRNLGVVHARGDWVAFIDSDCAADSAWLRILSRTAREADGDGRLAAVGGAQPGHPDDPPFARRLDRFLRAIGFIGDYVKPQTALSEVGHNAACNVLYRRREFLAAGGFRAGMFPGEDVDLDRRLTRSGQRILFNPAARVFHRRADGRAAWRRMLRAYGRASADNILIHGPFRMIQLVPPLLVLGAAAWLLALWRAPAGWLGLLWGLPPAGLAALVMLLRPRADLSWGDLAGFSGETLWFFSVGYFRRLFEHLGAPRIETARILPPLKEPGAAS